MLLNAMVIDMVRREDNPAYSLAGKSVWVAGHNGMVGSATLRRLSQESCEILRVERSEVDLRNQFDVGQWISDNKPQAIIVSAATVGGILANINYPVDFLYDNLMIATNIINAAHDHEVEKLLFIGSACIYPRDAEQPLSEESLLTGALEPTNVWHAVAKIAAIKLCQAFRLQHGRDFISAQPNNLYGPGDDFDAEASHVIPALMGKAHHAKIESLEALEVWGSGEVMREFMHVDDLADAAVFLLQNYSDDIPINIGSGEELTIRELAETICRVVKYDGGLTFDRSKPDGVPRKLLNGTRLKKLGWTANIPLEQGLQQTYDWYLDNSEVTRDKF